MLESDERGGARAQRTLSGSMISDWHTQGADGSPGRSEPLTLADNSPLRDGLLEPDPRRLTPSPSTPDDDDHNSTPTTTMAAIDRPSNMAITITTITAQVFLTAVYLHLTNNLSRCLSHVRLQAGPLRVFVLRDYSRGVNPRFARELPSLLQGRVRSGQAKDAEVWRVLFMQKSCEVLP